MEKATNVTKYDEGGWGMDLKAVSVEDVLKAPAVDAVEVVRCKDCKYYRTHGNIHGLCYYGTGMRHMYNDEFCSRSERRDDE